MLNNKDNMLSDPSLTILKVCIAISNTRVPKSVRKKLRMHKQRNCDWRVKTEGWVHSIHSVGSV